MSGFDAKGRPIRVPGIVPTPEGTLVHPHVHGATNWAPPAFSPRTGLFYVRIGRTPESSRSKACSRSRVGVNRRQTAMGQTNLLPFFNNDEEAYGVIRAYDPNTLDPEWEHQMADITWARRLVHRRRPRIRRRPEGYFRRARRAHRRAALAESLGGQINSAPMSFAVDGRQYIAIAAGSALFAFALPED